MTRSSKKPAMIKESKHLYKDIECRIGVFYIALSYTSCLAMIRF